MPKIKVIYNSSSTTAFKFRGSVIGHVAPKVLFFLLWSLLIYCINEFAFTTNPLKIETSLITLLGLVISLLLVFRTNTAYDRYWEGRRLWSDLSMAVRSMSRLIWVHVDEKDGKYDSEMKKKAIDILIAYPFSCKLLLRGEHGVNQTEICDYINHIPDIVRSPQAVLNLNDNNSSEYQVAPVSVEGECFHLPIILTHQISCFIAEVFRNGAISAPVATTLIANTNVLVASLTGFERILTTPIPTAYSVHLSQAIWLFCLCLPFQVLNMFKTNEWIMILVVCLVSFTMFGIVNIGEEIENPFGLDANDLPLTEYCVLLKNEIEAITRRPPPQVQDWVFKKEKATVGNTLQVPNADHTSVDVVL